MGQALLGPWLHSQHTSGAPWDIYKSPGYREVAFHKGWGDSFFSGDCPETKALKLQTWWELVQLPKEGKVGPCSSPSFSDKGQRAQDSIPSAMCAFEPEEKAGPSTTLEIKVHFIFPGGNQGPFAYTSAYACLSASAHTGGNQCSIAFTSRNQDPGCLQRRKAEIRCRAPARDLKTTVGPRGSLSTK